jgi:excinuclease ABC subunit A
VTSRQPALDRPCGLRLRGVRVHNLQGFDLDIPHNRLVVITGPSGSGKSSLAFDTIFAEGHRQYVESLSVYARQFLAQLERPDVDLIEGLEPTIAIDQRPAGHNPRSTVATVTEIYDYLRLLMARAGTPHCHQCGSSIAQVSPQQILETLLAQPEGTRAVLLAPWVRGRKGHHKEVLEAIRQAGFVRARIDGRLYDLDAVPDLPRQRPHTIEAVVDRVVLRSTAQARIAESLDMALRHGGGVVAVLYAPPSGSDDAWREELFNTRYACPQCGASFEEIEPRTFSFNSPYGACPACDGLGSREQFDPELVVPHRRRSLAEGAVAPWRGDTRAAQSRRQRQLQPILRACGIDWDTPLAQLKPAAFQRLLGGPNRRGTSDPPGLLDLLEEEWAATSDESLRQRLQACRGEVPCTACGGSRLRPEARSVRLSGRAIHEITSLSIQQAEEFFAALRLPPRQAEIARRVVPEIRHRLQFLHKVGLDYLTLDRPAHSLSGGEAQRVRLAAGIGSGLTGVCYVLDEPSIGLHPQDNARLIEAFRDLQRLGNTVLVVEHDEAVIRAADHVIDLGPGAGIHGGRVVAQGPPDAVAAVPESLTGNYLAGTQRIDVPAQRRTVDRRRMLVLEGAATNNLQHLTVAFPLGVLVCVTGPSGSGKSSLVNETLTRAIRRRLYGTGKPPGPFARLRGIRYIDKLVEIDQSPLGRTPRSNAATYTGAFDEIRKLFAATREARLRGYKSGRFSFNVRSGRCEHCQGQGLQRIEMNFLPDLYVQCPQCGGRRFNAATLEVRYRDRDIADVLDMTVDEARQFFANVPAVDRHLASLQQVGLGYLTLGQPSTTLSGGEAQRVKLATELARVASGNTLYVLDEPTTGLHLHDVGRLLSVLEQLVDRGNTVLVIEHHLDVIKRADYVIDLGPGGGARGGRIVGTGTPEDIAALADSATGACLRQVLR